MNEDEAKKEFERLGEPSVKYIPVPQNQPKPREWKLPSTNWMLVAAVVIFMVWGFVSLYSDAPKQLQASNYTYACAPSVVCPSVGCPNYSTSLECPQINTSCGSPSLVCSPSFTSTVAGSNQTVRVGNSSD